MHALLGGVPAKGSNVFRVPKVPKHPKAPKAPKLPPSINVPSNQPNTTASVTSASTTSPESSGGVKNWLGGVKSPTSIRAPTTSSVTTISSKHSAQDAALSDEDAEDGATVISRTKSAGNGSRGSNKAPRNTAANTLSGLNDRLGEIISIFKDFNSKLNIGLAPPASPVITPSQTALVENHSTTSTIVPPIGTTSLTPPTASGVLQGSLSMQPAHAHRRAAITFMIQYDKYLGVNGSVKLLHLFEQDVIAMDTYLSFLESDKLCKVVSDLITAIIGRSTVCLRWWGVRKLTVFNLGSRVEEVDVGGIMGLDEVVQYTDSRWNLGLDGHVILYSDPQNTKSAL
ncbi:hypothetical protein SERLA73DRAFT_69346 [Serpula lacrymans var. lacrymans S7.3]|uniref:Uncharacterized protein n=1 Tax=Serpula lacrymans var. lacrymans (strain S7.3) TaxID=936435 RepID=F8PJR7_SERL3|nr:hypothetical protein SERLA73DRAFT_69346 [Serpula lacrymans var. lacrymans S7.3]